MGLFNRGKDKRDEGLRESGTRVPALLVKRKESAWESSGGGVTTGNEYKGNKTTMWFEAHTPEGKVIKFKEEALWGPSEGQWLEAACDDERENAVLIMDLSSMNWINDDQEEIRRQLQVSARKAQALRDGTAAPSDGELGAAGGPPAEAPKSLKDALGG
jgi:hypothetical protein